MHSKYFEILTTVGRIVTARLAKPTVEVRFHGYSVSHLNGGLILRRIVYSEGYYFGA
jgi:hypothetical protein